jgi:hypothetical protein
MVFSGGEERRSLLPPILRNGILRNHPNGLAGLGWSEQTFAMKSKAPPGFINVDLDIVSRAKLGAIEASVSQTAYSLYSGPIRKGIFLLRLECNSDPDNADTATVKLCEAIEALGGNERRLWERALKRTFDVGYEIIPGCRAVHVSLRPETLKRVTALGATVAFTCYLGDDSHPSVPMNGRQSIHRMRRPPSSVTGSGH